MASESTRPRLLCLLVGNSVRSTTRRIVSIPSHIVPLYPNAGQFLHRQLAILHRAIHTSAFLYKAIHSRHHRLYVPYSYGALYNHPVEGFLLDSRGAVIEEWLTGMSVRQAALLFTIATFKTVDDHCGYSLPFDPLQWFTGNNFDYHGIHHRVDTPCGPFWWTAY